MKVFTYLVMAFLAAGIIPGHAQNKPVKKKLTHDNYDSWKSVTGDSLSNNGAYALYSINPQEGDGVLEIATIAGNKISKYPRGSRASFTADSKHAIFLIKPEAAKVRAAKLKKKKPEDMPKDSLAIITLETGKKQTYDKVKSFKVAKNGGGWVAFLREPAPATKEPIKPAAASEVKKPVTPARVGATTVKKTEVGDLVILDLAANKPYTFTKISSYILSDKGNMVYFTKEHPDSTRRTAVYGFNTKTQQTTLISKGKFTYKNLATDRDGTQLAFLATHDSTNKDVRNFTLHYWNAKDKRVKTVADTSYKGMLKNWLVSENGSLLFSRNGKRLFFGTFPKPRPYEKDTTKLDEEKVNLDIWNWKDPLIQPMQLKNTERELKRSFVAMYDISSKKLMQLATLEIPEISFDPERVADVALGVSDVNYLMSVGYDSPSKKDIFLIDLKNGNRKLALKATRGATRLSPAGNYIYWYEPADSTWFTYNIKSGVKNNLTKKLPVRFFDELNDVPAFPDDYGAVGWLPQDNGFLIYDRFDIWKLDPSGKNKPVNITDGYGRKNDLQLRYVNLDVERLGKAIDLNEPFILSALRFSDKASGFYRDYLNKTTEPEKLIFGEKAYLGLKKAKDSGQILFRQSTYQQYPDVYATTLTFNQPQKLTNANPQQTEYAWGTVELVHWKSIDNIPLEGLLYKPENFDPNKKYPMIVYFYERSAETLHRYFPPAPSASTVNRALAVSNDYLLFVPDIVYKNGYPGESAMNCIMPGVMNLMQKGFVDEKNIALQGQSWGGYQIAFMVTRTNLFKAAMAGAPVANMTSAYGGIRWESGMSRQFQYEKGQSRIGGNLWEKPLLYIENSPLFFADKIETPLLIMSNDNDGAVPHQQGIEMFMAMRRLNKPAWMLVYNGEAHNLMERKNRKDLSVRMMQFFDFYLKGAPMPAWMKKGVPSIYKGKEYGYELTEETSSARE